MFILDRFEGNTAVIENGDEFIKTDRKNISDNAVEGDVLTESNGFYTADKDSTKKRKEEILKLQNSLWG
ncbi:MAG: DUF3006 domain-containing protein [Oscillospiraceae bacterium]|nr:DUF3006 domain-containing protein [Oscillospiraceae bacterium]